MKFTCKCLYCLQSSPPFIWQVEPDLVWVEIPKNASKAIKAKFDTNKSFNRLRRQKINPSRLKKGFVVIRDPVSRFKSLLAHYFSPEGARYHHGTAWLEKYNTQRTPITNNNVCEFVLSRFRFIGEIAEPHHWSSQTSFIPSEFYELERHQFYDMNWVKFNFAVKNSSPSNTIQIENPEVKILKRLYADDFELMSYLKPSPRFTYHSPNHLIKGEIK